MSDYQKYSECDLLRLAKRVNNTKRSYLLVNPLQGKHIPVDPEAALTMMQALGKTVKENYEENHWSSAFLKQRLQSGLPWPLKSGMSVFIRKQHAS